MRILDLRSEAESPENEVLKGLQSSRKTISPKYLYDRMGGELFERICQLDEYYLFRTELEILRSHRDDIAARVPDGSVLFEFGSGTGVKTRLLLESLRNLGAYAPIDISKEMLRASTERLSSEFPGLRLLPVCSDFTREVEGLTELFESAPARAAFFPGSTIGNLDPPEALAFLKRTARMLGPGGALIVGVDIVKNHEVLEAAYNDRHGVTAQFNLNVLRRLNHELGADFDLSSFRHRALYNALLGRIEMHLISEREQEASVAGTKIRFRQGESIHTESSYKYQPARFERMARKAGFIPGKAWTDRDAYFCVYLLRVAEGAETVALAGA